MFWSTSLRHFMLVDKCAQQIPKPPDYRSIVLHGRRNLPFFGNLAEKASCVDDKTVLFRYTFINCFSVICLKSVSQHDTAVSSQKRPKSILNTDNPYQVACL